MLAGWEKGAGGAGRGEGGEREVDFVDPGGQCGAVHSPEPSCLCCGPLWGVFSWGERVKQHCPPARRQERFSHVHG